MGSAPWRFHRSIASHDASPDWPVKVRCWIVHHHNQRGITAHCPLTLHTVFVHCLCPQSLPTVSAHCPCTLSLHTLCAHSSCTLSLHNISAHCLCPLSVHSSLDPLTGHSLHTERSFTGTSAETGFQGQLHTVQCLAHPFTHSIQRIKNFLNCHILTYHQSHL